MSNTYKLNVNISIIFWSMVVVGLIALYIMNERKKKQESGYLFLDGSYFINSPYVDSYPQY
jgi:hypothetical protein